MAMENLSGRMEAHMKEPILMEKNKGKANFYFLLNDIMRGIGCKERKMGEADCWMKMEIY